MPADRIQVMDDRRICESGSHRGLTELTGFNVGSCKSQMKAADLDLGEVRCDELDEPCHSIMPLKRND